MDWREMRAQTDKLPTNPRELREPPAYTIPGTWGQQLVDKLCPQPGDAKVDKHRSSAFVGTALDLILRSNGIRTVVVCGVITQGCVESDGARCPIFGVLRGIGQRLC